jgi:hypothetical protein
MWSRQTFSFGQSSGVITERITTQKNSQLVFACDCMPAGSGGAGTQFATLCSTLCAAAVQFLKPMT